MGNMQTIWTALNTENELMINIINIPFAFIEMYVSLLLFTTILNIDVNKKQKALYVIILGLLGLITSCTIPVPYNTFINIIACPVFVYFLFNTNLLKSILAEIIPYIFFVLFSLLIANIFTIITKLPITHIQHTPIYKFVFSCLIYMFAYLLYIFIKRFNVNLTMSNLKNKKNTTILFLNLVVGILAIFGQSYLATFYNNLLPFYITATSILIILIYFFISMYSLSRTNKLESATQDLEEERLYNKTITILYDNIRGFKHDFNNIVQSIGGYISTNNIEGLKDYYNDLLDDCKKVNNLAVLNPELINNPAIYSLLTSKYHQAESLGIIMNFEVFLDLKSLNIKTYDLSRILGVLIDNAIEASSMCDGKEINLNHGLGLWEVRKILKKNNNLNLFTTKDNKFFKQQLEIYI